MPYADSLSVRGRALKSPRIRPFFADSCAPLDTGQGSESLSDARLSLRLFTSAIRYPFRFYALAQAFSGSSAGCGFELPIGVPMEFRKTPPHRLPPLLAEQDLVDEACNSRGVERSARFISSLDKRAILAAAGFPR